MRILASGFTGLLWGIAAGYITTEAWGDWSYLAAPSGILIGISIYYISRLSYKYSWFWQIPVSLITLFIAGAGFGIALGIVDMVVNPLPNKWWAPPVESLFGVIFGLIFYHFAWILFPFALANHTLMRFIERNTSNKAVDATA